MRQETGDKKKDKRPKKKELILPSGAGIEKLGTMNQETGDRRQATGDRRQETGDRNQDKRQKTKVLRCINSNP